MSHKVIKIPKDVKYTGEYCDWIYNKVKKFTEFDDNDVEIKLGKNIVTIKCNDEKALNKFIKKLKPVITKTTNPLLAALK